MMKVSQMINKLGNPAANQFILTDSENSLDAFQSYSSRIVTVDHAKKIITLGEDWNYSRTTSKHRNIFFDDYESMHELATLDGLKKAIKRGYYNDYIIKLA